MSLPEKISWTSEEPSEKSRLRAAEKELERSVLEAVKEYSASTGRIVESIDVTTEGVGARTRVPNDIDIAMGWV